MVWEGESWEVEFPGEWVAWDLDDQAVAISNEAINDVTQELSAGAVLVVVRRIEMAPEQASAHDSSFPLELPTPESPSMQTYRVQGNGLSFEIHLTVGSGTDESDRVQARDVVNSLRFLTMPFQTRIGQWLALGDVSSYEVGSGTPESGGDLGAVIVFNPPDRRPYALDVPDLDCGEGGGVGWKSSIRRIRISCPWGAVAFYDEFGNPSADNPANLSVRLEPLLLVTAWDGTLLLPVAGT